MPFVHQVRVRYGEVDQQGVVFNAHWLTFVDHAMTEFFRYLGYPPKETWLELGTFDVMLVKAELQWAGPVGFDDLIDIVVRPDRLGGKSFDLRFAATVDGREVFEAVVTYVTIDPSPRSHGSSSNGSIRIPDELRARLESDRAAGGA